ncbi:MAG: PAS domain S-box protein [Syntrophobacteraceae bacterium]
MLLLLSVSIGVQLTATVLALRLIPVSRERGAWVLVSASLGLMTLGQCLTLFLVAWGRPSLADDWITEGVALAASALMLAGIARISPLLQALDASVRVLKESEERKRAEEQLRASERRYRTLVENIGGTVYIADGNGRFTFVTPQAEELTGYTRQQLLGMSFRELMDPESLAMANTRFANVTAGGTLEPTELIIRHADGRRIPIETFTSLVPGEPDDTSVAIQGLVRDITQRKHTEAERTLLATAIKQASEGVVITDASAHVLYANPAFEKMSGYAQSELLGRSISLVQSGAHPDEYHREVLACLARGEAWKGRFINKNKSGRLFQVQATIYPIRDPNGIVTHHVAVENDITRSVQLEKQLQQVQKMDMMGKLASGMAHDFNNMLAVAIGQAELLGDTLAKDDPSHRNVELILQACHHAKDLLRRILALGRTETIEGSLVSLPEIVETVLSFLRPDLAPGVHIEIEEAAPREALSVWADPTQMQQVLMNLCTNALYAMQSGGGTLRLRFERETINPGDPEPVPTLSPGDYVKLTVADTGKGIDGGDPEMLEKIFEPFFSTKPAGQGTGLGLALVYAIVINHGGAITVESEPGVGTRFQVYLPQQA